MKRIAVIGSGISGLAAALKFHQLNLQTGDPAWQVTVFEASGRVGGVLQTLNDGPYLIECSADNFATLIPDAWQMSQEWELDSELIQPNVENRQALVLNRSRLLPIPAGFSLMQPTRLDSILTTRTLSWPAKLRLLSEYWVPRRRETSDESLESFAVRRLGRETYENLVEPIVSGIFTADPATLSMQATMPQFVELERRAGGLIRGHLAAKKNNSAAAARRASGARYDQFVAPKHGMTQWVEALAAKLPVGTLKLESPVQSVVLDPTQATGWCVNTACQSLGFDAVICTAPAAVTARQLAAALPDVANRVACIPYASSAVVAMVVPRSELKNRIDAFGLIVPRKEGRDTLAISFTSNKYPGRVPSNEILLRVFLGGALRPEVIDKSDTELVELAYGELRAILGWTGSRPRWQAVLRWREAMPQYLVGHVERMQELQNALSDQPTLKLCGAAYAGVGIPQCVRGARQAASELAAYFGTTPDPSS